MAHHEFYSFDETLERRPLNGDPFDWEVIREDYRQHHRTIENGRQLRACLREGKYAFPGGYPLYFITPDGAALSFEAVRDNLSSVIWSIRHSVNGGWRVIGMGMAYGSGELDDPDNVYCDHTGNLID